MADMTFPQGGVLLAVDGNSVVHRAYHAFERTRRASPSGEPVWALWGLLWILSGVAHQVRTRYGRLDGLVIGFDDPDSSRRRLLDPAYKASRAEKPAALIEQLSEAVLLCAQAGFCTVVHPAEEADDVVASAASAVHARGGRTIVATSDRDAFALVSGHTCVYRLGVPEHMAWLGTEALSRQLGISLGPTVGPDGPIPAYTALAALRGDPSDNLPGVPGVGAKTAAKLLNRFGDVLSALADPDELVRAIGPKAAGAVRDHERRWRHNVTLMSLRTDLPVPLDAACLPVGLEGFAPVLGGYGLGPLRPRMASLAA